jgi:hypothetical protein
MKIMNYTTAISASKSITEIETLLADNGASHIMKEYRGDGRVWSLAFKLGEIGYKLPANTERVFATLTKGKRNFQRKAWEEQSERVAWRVLKDWLLAQLSLIAIGQAEFDQVMLPYAFDGKQTLYERIKSSEDLRGKLLGGPSD